MELERICELMGWPMPSDWPDDYRDGVMNDPESFTRRVMNLVEVAESEARQAPMKLIEVAVRNAKNHHPCPTMPRWHAVKTIFACGKTTAHELCERFGMPPSEELLNPAALRGEGE